MLNRTDLITLCNEAIQEGKDLCIEVTIPGQNDTEFIINSCDSIKNKLEYYCKVYDENLVHSMNDKIRIINIKKINFLDNTNYNFVSEEKELVCEKCKKTFYVDKHDKREYGELGLPYVNCHYCNEKVYIEDENGIDVDNENLEFPNHFFSFENGVDIDKQRIQDWAREALETLIKNPETKFVHTGSGNTVVIGLQYEDEIYIIVAKKYFEFTYDKEE